MHWLDLNLPLSEQFEVEKQVRCIQACTDMDELRHIAVALLRLSSQQAYVSSQLVSQVAKHERTGGCPVTDEHMAWAAELLAQRPCS